MSSIKSRPIDSAESPSPVYDEYQARERIIQYLAGTVKWREVDTLEEDLSMDPEVGVWYFASANWTFTVQEIGTISEHFRPAGLITVLAVVNAIQARERVEQYLNDEGMEEEIESLEYAGEYPTSGGYKWILFSDTNTFEVDQNGQILPKLRLDYSDF